MFIDQVIIQVKSGDGGGGCISFRREKYVPKGGPDGGDGGRGGSVILESSFHYQNLNHFRNLEKFRAENGGQGRGKKMKGADGKDVVIGVPPGTLVYDDEMDDLIYDFDSKLERIVIAEGGNGGIGNVHFKSSTNQAPRRATSGKPGMERRIRLELKVLADVGLVGLPNAGKSSLLRRVSKARPRVASYPFTTLNPNLGIVRIDEFHSFTVADIPGLIEGAHEGTGLGDKFLKHIERTKYLVHLIDISQMNPLSPEKSYKIIRSELRGFSQQLISKPEIVALNKIDTVSDRKDLNAEKEKFEKSGTPCFLISAKTGEGVNELISFLSEHFLKEKHILYGDISGVTG